jgi:hypothetical protein
LRARSQAAARPERFPDAPVSMGPRLPAMAVYLLYTLLIVLAPRDRRHG